MAFDDPAFWRAGAVSTIVVMSVVLIMLTVDSLADIRTGGSHVPPYTVVNQEIGYKLNAQRGEDVPVIGKAEPLFGKPLDAAAARALIEKGKMVIQSRACIDCHTFFGNGAYYAPDLTKAWLDPDWEAWKAITGAQTREEAMVRFLMDPVKYRTWTRAMPNLHLSETEAHAVVAYLKWMSAVNANGFPPNFNIQPQQ
jgi:nitric oxide reductase subunit C